MKKKIWKLFNKVDTIIAKVREYNDLVYDNRYSDRMNPELSFNVKLYNIITINSDDIKKYLLSLDIAEDSANMRNLLNEFDDDRLDGIYHHYLQDMAEMFREDVKQKDHYLHDFINGNEINFYGRNGGHMCLGSLSSYHLEITETEFNQYPNYDFDRKDWDSYYRDPNKTIKEEIEMWKEHFGLRTQLEVYALLKNDIDNGDLGNYYQKAIDGIDTIEKLQDHLKEIKANQREYFDDFWKREIDAYRDENFSFHQKIEYAKNNNLSHLDFIERYNQTDAWTNRNAKVPYDSIKRMLWAINKEMNIVGKHIGPYVVNEVEKVGEMTFVKIGCHVFLASMVEENINDINKLIVAQDESNIVL